MKHFKLILFLSFLFIHNQKTFALCIGCGCEKAYKNCLDGNGADWCSTWPQLYSGEQLENCCVEKRNDCHGTGITIRLGFSIANGIIGNNEGGQIIVPYHLLNSAQIAQIPSQLQQIIDFYLDGNQLTNEQLKYLESFDPA